MRRESRFQLTAGVVPLLVGLLSNAPTRAGNGGQARHVDPPPAPTMVTTSRRPERIDEVPISVTVLDADELAAKDVQTSFDLPPHVPGFVFKTTGVIGQPYIRGVGSDLASAGADPSVATFVDGVYRTRGASADQHLYDVDRVEIVKGPLGTLYGRNATGGAVRVFSRPPSFDLAAEGEASYGSYDALRLGGMLNVPLLEDRLALRVAALRSRRDGYSENVFLDDDLDDEDFRALRGQLLARPHDDVTVRLVGDWARQDDARHLAAWPDPNCCLNPGLALGGSVPGDRREVRNDFENEVEREDGGVSAEVAWDLGRFELRSLGAWRQTHHDQAVDLDSTQAPFGLAFPRERSTTWSEEIQLLYEAGRLEALGGIYFLHEDANHVPEILLPAIGIRNRPTGAVETDAWALFGEARYRISDRWRLTAGARVSLDERSIDYTEQTRVRLPSGSEVVVDARSFDDEKSWSAITPRFIAEYAPSDGLLAYASASRGFKAGGFNTTALQPSFDPEFLWSFELGLKMRRADDRARLRAAVFWYDYDDLQLPTLAPDRPASEFPIIVNAARARILGLESEFSWRPLRGIETNLALALLDAEFRSFVSVDGNNPVDDPDRSGNRMPQAPELSTSAGVSYVRDLSGRGSVMARIDWSYRSRTYYNPFEDPEVDQGGYHLLRASAEYTLPSGRWSVALLGENLTDRLYAQNVFRIDSSTGALRFWGPPRTVSVRLRGRF